MLDNLSITLEKGIQYLISLQNKDGSWTGDYGGPVFLVPLYLGTMVITQSPLTDEEKSGFVQYIQSIQNKDGSIGLHELDHGSMFTTSLLYAVFRLLGFSAEVEFLQRMQQWILQNGTPLGAASWGKFFLCLLNLYPYDGINPLLPELWKLPNFFPIHPKNMWCHSRQVYLPMAYLYSLKAKIKDNPIIQQIREEIYGVPFQEIKFEDYVNYVAPSDLFTPYSLPLIASNKIMKIYETKHSTLLRKQAKDELLQHILFEDQSTHYLNLGPVNSAYNTLVHYFRDPHSHVFKHSLQGLKAYLSWGNKGLKINGYNSTAIWDTSFAVLSLSSAHLKQQNQAALIKSYRFIKENQLKDNLLDSRIYFRDNRKGAWPFSDANHGWPVSDCTAEAFMASLSLEEMVEDRISDTMLQEAIQRILEMQNKNGGWAPYEKTRGSFLLEYLNPSSVFGKIMVDYPCVECTSSCIQALNKAKGRLKGFQTRKIDQSIQKGARYIQNEQNSDGSFYGTWAVCYTYGTYFGILGLLAAGFSPSSREIRKACSFLIDHQNGDGGWGEHFSSCKEKKWIPHSRSQIAQSAWALIGLISAGLAKTKSVERGITFLLEQQLDNGDWPEDDLVGVFNQTVLINYEHYRRYFPIWAISLYKKALTDFGTRGNKMGSINERMVYH